MRVWVNDHIAEHTVEGLADILAQAFSSEICQLLSKTKPPTIEELTHLGGTIVKDVAAYLLIAVVDDHQPRLYAGSATNNRNGFRGHALACKKVW